MDFLFFCLLTGEDTAPCLMFKLPRVRGRGAAPLPPRGQLRVSGRWRLGLTGVSVPSARTPSRTGTVSAPAPFISLLGKTFHSAHSTRRARGWGRWTMAGLLAGPRSEGMDGDFRVAGARGSACPGARRPAEPGAQFGCQAGAPACRQPHQLRNGLRLGRAAWPPQAGCGELPIGLAVHQEGEPASATAAWCPLQQRSRCLVLPTGDKALSCALIPSP